MAKISSLRETALAYLARRDYSSNALQAKLLKKGYETEQVNELLLSFTERGYLNDAALCRRLYENYLEMPQMGYYKIRYKLYQQGFNGELVESILRLYDFEVEKEKLEQLVNTFQEKTLVPTKLPKIARSLAAKGFSNENIRKVLSKTIADL